jgi:alkenylglycerophosphocholine/alkenylglycerophosphoethanolamine hydrolase
MNLIAISGIAISIVCYFYSPGPLIKALPIWLMICLVAFWSPYKNSSKSTPLNKTIIASGLLLSSIGDILLEIDDESHGVTKELFIGGLFSFLIAHICYCKAFWDNITSLNSAFILPFSILFFIFMFILLPNVESDMLIPVIVYGITIVTMVYLAFCRWSGQSIKSSSLKSNSSLLSLVGALIFLSSDVTLGLNKFAFPIKNAKHIVMITYYSGQFLITLSATKE